MNSTIQPKVSCVHVGIHKTATTWMQLHGFALHPKIKLLNAVGSPFEEFWYREFMDCGEFGFDRARVAARVEQELRAFDDDKDAIPIISEENITGHIYTGSNAKRNAEHLFELFGRCKIFMLIRRQPDYLASAYSNFINHGGSLSFRGWMQDQNIPVHWMINKLKYDQLISYYHSLFGPENVLVLPYEMFARDRGVTVMNKFFEFVGAGPLEEDRFSGVLSKKTNPGLSPLGVRLARMANCARGRITYNQARIIRAADRFVLRKLPLQPRLMTKSEALEYSEQFRASNLATSQLIGIDLKDYGYAA